MVRYVTPEQYNRMVRQQQQRQRQEINRINREVDAHNRKVKREIDKHNREVEAHNRKVNQAISQHNREVNAHNARVRANQQRLRSELAKLRRQTVTTRYVDFQVSVKAVQTAYDQLEYAAEPTVVGDRYNEILDLSEREAANNAGLMNALLGDASSSDAPPPDSEESPLTPFLQSISIELGDRWKGALFSLSPHNPDAARHFCTSAREIIARILDVKAPDHIVAVEVPNCDLTPQGTPSRRAKIKYFLHLQGLNLNELEAFIESDINNVVELFQTFNEGTHGSAGKFDFSQLQAIRKRVEDGILFLSRLVPSEARV